MGREHVDHLVEIHINAISDQLIIQSINQSNKKSVNQ